MARKLKLIPKGAENSKGYDFEIKFNPEAGANCLVKYRAQVYVRNREYFTRFLNDMVDVWLIIFVSKSLNFSMSITQD